MRYNVMQESVLPVQPNTSAAAVSASLSMIPLDLIDDGTRLRTVDEAQVGALVDSIKEVGLLNPITVYRRQVIRADVFVDGYGIVAGAHRTTAGRRLGWTEIAAHIVELSDLQRQIAECDENLQGPKLTASQRALFTRRRKEAYEALHPEARHGGDRKGDQVANLATRSFAEDTALKTGKSAREIRRDATRGERLGDDAEKLVGTSLDSGVELDALASMTPEERKPIIDRAAAGEKVTARKIGAESISDLPTADGGPQFPADHAIVRIDGTATPAPIEAQEQAERRQEALAEAADLIVAAFKGDTDKIVSLLEQGQTEMNGFAFMIRSRAAQWAESFAPATAQMVEPTEAPAATSGQLSQVVTAVLSDEGLKEADVTGKLSATSQPESSPATPAPLSVVPTAIVSGNVTETSHPASKITHLIAAKHAPKSYPGAGEGWKQRHGRRH
ncbi:MAG: ParB N-terminal domain-containing protein [Parvibaculum sp.]|nr:ParB N-terminal domain-containing protein [Parvibaculum sp.]